MKRCLLLLSLLATLGLLAAAFAAPAPVDYRREIRPILAANCLGCHGADEHKRSANLRLDEPNAAVVPGDILASKLVQRVQSGTMPPKESGHTLTPAQKQLLMRWIGQGAKYEGHWAFVAPASLPPAPSLPLRPNFVGGKGGGEPTPLTPPLFVPRNEGFKRREGAGGRNAGRDANIDSWIAARLAKEKLTLSPEADRWTLARRVALDLTGLPPSPKDAEAFVNDKAPNAYEKFVDSQLASPHFGEKWARVWLDLGRYADSAGYGSDPLRPNLWPWRDWLIAAFNNNKPFDQFTLEMLAGDLLPGATDDQKIATAFHRNTMTNTEGGTDDEEFRMAAVKDRTIVTMQAWMGLTFQCAQCHTHKFDPISKTDFYRTMAIFNQTEDNDRGDEFPTLPVLTAAQREKKQALEKELAELERQRAAEPVGKAPSARFVRVTLPGTAFLMLAEVQALSGSENVARKGKASQSSTDFGGEAARALDGNTSGKFPDNTVTHTKQEKDPWWEVDLGATYPLQSVVVWPRTDAHPGMLANLRVTLYDENRKVVGEQGIPGAILTAKTALLTDSPTAQKLAQKQAELAALKPIALPVLRELPEAKRRVTHALTLANFLQPEEVVTPAGPARFAPPAPKEGGAWNRLSLAKWLVSRENPLTARVQVNRFWAQLFGVGLVETEEDFGTQGALPTHPELLDSLALDFQRDWNVKRLLKTIVMSRTYRQSSKLTPERLARDPKARLLSRYPRRRLDAEGIRDQALLVSGLLSHKLGGPSVYPPQPDGLWKAAFNGERSYPTSTGEDRYRRGLYTFWRRTVPYPSMQTFDAPSREFCTVRRLPTNTPLQALVTLNDPAYLEMAVGLAKRLQTEGGTTPAERARQGLRLALCRPANEAQVAPLVALFESEKAHYVAHPMEAKKLTGTEKEDPELAAWTVVANVLLNLDGVLTKG
ncbi:DUF1553 domain-containing protein [Armatimonas rosea]|uniref:Fucolectin tachylectin-4 pentraxin-1 domain-containing protein n=1 Tax=Armatimonas rosea TaxID=685828 RepID=A0A7W9SKU4_ARMRO|nr:DUF1553 domain-containing protein [Armatimonas rosea]MBB6048487.1 hypothetical protein [Armatimonas rosea]